jgi:glutamate synthase (NADPH) small chain
MLVTGKHTGFLTDRRLPTPERPVALRLNDFSEIYMPHGADELRRQSGRCMDCGVPFCQAGPGCPIDNLIPEWNDLVHRGLWREAYNRLALTNNFPEITGRVCPAPCEHACVLGITDQPVAIKSIEQAIADRAFDEGWVRPRRPANRTGRRVAIIGSGPAGLAAADQLNRVGHLVTVFERDDRIGGLLTYGVPNMKLDKGIVQRRVDLLAAEGVAFRVNSNVGEDFAAACIASDFDAMLLACGALRQRDLDLPGRNLRGIHPAMDYLRGVTRGLLDQARADQQCIDAGGRHVVVIGGGDTGADCIATALRQGCAGILNITRRKREPRTRDADHPWPGPTGTYFLDYAHVEGHAFLGRDPRQYCVRPLEFVGDRAGHVRAVRVERTVWETGLGGTPGHRPNRSIEDIPAELVLLAVGFTSHDAPAIVRELGLRTVQGKVPGQAGGHATAAPGVYVAGDMRRGPSLLVWAMAEGRAAALEVTRFLAGASRARPLLRRDATLPREL